MTKNKIVFILGSTELGGAENQAIILGAEFVKQNDFDVEFVLFGWKQGKTTMKLDKLGFPYHVIKTPTSAFLLLKYLFFLRKLRPTILLPYGTYPNIFTSLIWKYTSAKLCFWNQRDEGLALNKNWYTHKAISNASGYIANSTSAKYFLIKKFEISEKRISVIYNGLVKLQSSEEQNFWRAKNSFDFDDVLIAMVANLSTFKDHETLLRSFKIVRAKYLRKPVKLLLAGRFDNNYIFLLNLAKELNITDDTYFLGKIEDVGNLLNAIDLSVLSSKSEGLSNVIIESMLSEVPVTGSRINGIIEALGEDYQKYLAEPGNYEDLADKILFFLNSPATALELVKVNKLRASSQFALNNLYGKTLNVLIRDFHK